MKHRAWNRTIRPIFLAGVLLLHSASMIAAPGNPRPNLPTPVDKLLQRFCIECHDADTAKGGLNLAGLQAKPVADNSPDWERVVRKLASRQMPPVGRDRPDDRHYERAIRDLTGILDAAAHHAPNPGRTDSFRRLNRTEYANTIRDLLALEIDATALLPKDDAGHGFDNVTVADLSPTLLNRYIAAAEKISRLALGTPTRSPGGETYRLRPDITQEHAVEGLPLGTRGGTVLTHTFPREGEYEITIRLTRDRNEEVEGLHEPHDLVFLLDRRKLAGFVVAPPGGGTTFETVDAHLKTRFFAPAGPHQVGVTFLRNPASLVETRRQPYSARYNMHRHPRLTPAIYQISITGPHTSASPGDSPSRRRILGDTPVTPGTESARAEELLRPLLRRAYRRPITNADLLGPMQFFQSGLRNAGFEAGMESALAAILVNPAFLFRIEADPANRPPGAVYRIDDIALASRLSYFVWGSMPDDTLLRLAEADRLHEPAILETQVRRMLADDRARNLVSNFAAQWLHLRNLDSVTPDLRLFPDWDDNLRQAFRRETELHFEALLRDDRPVLDLIIADHTYLNERLARHYGIPHVVGSHFRRVPLPPSSHRGGLLRQGSILTVTSYATRTSPVIRGNWILGTLLGNPPPPPPANVPALQENTVSSSLPMRQRLAQHRANPACASCHDLMDPVGFALENFDAIGRWRSTEEGETIDATGGLPDGSRFDGVAGLEAGLRRHPEAFVTALTERLLTFGLGRGLESADAPAVRAIVRDSARSQYRLSSLITGIVKSPPFTLRRNP